MVEHLVKSEDDLPAYRYLFENIRYEPDYDFAMKRAKQVGEMGVVLCYLPRSPFMRMLVLDIGIDTVAYLASNFEDEFMETFEVVRKNLDKASRIAVDSPAEILMIPENLSAEMVGPKFFEKYLKKFQTEWSGRIKAAGKYSCIHMDGTLKALLKEECSIGLTFIEACTPRPAGDLGIEEWPAYIENNQTILWGGIPGVYFTDKICEAEFDRHLKEVLSVMRTKPRYVLGVADQVPPDGVARRVCRVRELVDEFGVYR
ncbi:MAG: hypothetical protein AB1798_10885 [Spirochaetota bacterium]